MSTCPHGLPRYACEPCSRELHAEDSPKRASPFVRVEPSPTMHEEREVSPAEVHERLTGAMVAREIAERPRSAIHSQPSCEKAEAEVVLLRLSILRLCEVLGIEPHPGAEWPSTAQRILEIVKALKEEAGWRKRR